MTVTYYSLIEITDYDYLDVCIYLSLSGNLLIYRFAYSYRSAWLGHARNDHGLPAGLFLSLSIYYIESLGVIMRQIIHALFGFALLLLSLPVFIQISTQSLPAAIVAWLGIVTLSAINFYSATN